jgi:hypothetical protein
MSETIASLLAALVGATIGSVGAVVIQSWLSAKSERRRQREAVVQRYLYQLQDSVESLWYRLKNLTDFGGRVVMEDEYFATSSLYSLGRVLALERILILEGVYPQLETLNPGLGAFLRDHRVDLQLAPVLYQYDRLVLAEAVMEREGPHFRTSSYLEFRARYDNRQQEARDPFHLAVLALDALERKNPRREFNTEDAYRQVEATLGAETLRSLMDLLSEIAVRLEVETRVSSSLREVVRLPPIERRPLRIFISYRREDAPGHVGRLYDDLVARFGKGEVLVEIEPIQAGADFVRSIKSTVGSCDVLIAVIGKQWIFAEDGSGHRRLDNPEDPVRLEVQAALERDDILCIPVLVQDARMPDSAELPKPLAPLAHHQALVVSEIQWSQDVGVVNSTIEDWRARRSS